MARSRLVALAGGVGLVLLGCGLVVALELTLRAIGIGAEPPSRDPFAGFSTILPVFQPGRAPDGTPLWEVTEIRRPAGAERGIAFRAEKPAHGFRVFLVGGSTAAGVPYPPELAFGGWLERGLAEAFPDLEIEVVNLAVSGYASQRLLPVVRELVRHEPDLLVVYMGHNEFAERRYYARYAELDPRLFRLWEWTATTHLYRLLGRLLPEDPDVHDPERRMRAIRDRPGVEMFGVASGGDEIDAAAFEREAAVRDALWEARVREMVRLASGAGARTALLGLAQNQADWAPGASSHRPDLSGADRERWETLRARGAAAAGPEESLALYREALALDDTHAGLHYDVARSLHAAGDLAGARRHYRLASDLDRIPHGAPGGYSEVLREIAGETGSLFVDVDAALREASGERLVGNDLFVDFVHPNLEAHQRIALALLAALRGAGLPRPAAEWPGAPPAWPAPESLRDAALQRREWLVRLSVCRIARRPECLERAARSLLSLDPDDRLARAALEGLADLR